MRSLLYMFTATLVVAAGVMTYSKFRTKPLESEYLTVVDHEEMVAPQQDLEPVARRRAERTPLPHPSTRTEEAMATNIERPLSVAEETEAAQAELEALQPEAMRLLKEMTGVYDTPDRRIFVDSHTDIPESNDSMQIMRGYIGSRMYFVPVMRPDAEEFFRVQDRMTALSAQPNVLHARALESAGG